MVFDAARTSEFPPASRERNFVRKQAGPPYRSPFNTAVVCRLQPPTFKTAQVSFGLGPIGQLHWARSALSGILALLLCWGQSSCGALPFWWVS